MFRSGALVRRDHPSPGEFRDLPSTVQESGAQLAVELAITEFLEALCFLAEADVVDAHGTDTRANRVGVRQLASTDATRAGCSVLEAVLCDPRLGILQDGCVSVVVARVGVVEEAQAAEVIEASEALEAVPLFQVEDADLDAVLLAAPVLGLDLVGAELPGFGVRDRDAAVEEFELEFDVSVGVHLVAPIQETSRFLRVGPVHHRPDTLNSRDISEPVKTSLKVF